MKSLDQIRAAFAWEKVQDAITNKQLDEYTVLVKKFPAMIATNGLGQAMAFLISKAKMDLEGSVETGKVQGRVFTHVQQWLRHEQGHYRGPYAGSDRKNLIMDIYENDCLAYRQAQGEALAILGYLRMFAAGCKNK